MAKQAGNQPRPPIVAVLGHVDHGKTSLLDAIRNSQVQAGETGGITQHIGAYQISHNNRLITFIDTPGHAAFSKMRARGGRIADLAILVVAADDGVMPQTKESIKHIKDAGIPMLVAINKVDLPGADIVKTKTSLAENEVYVEGFGGNIPVVEVSATKRLGLDDLLENLLLLAELEELKADPKGTLEAIVIESSLDKRQGPIATLIIKNGTLKKTDQVVAISDHKLTAKIKSMVDWLGNEKDELLPSAPAKVLGFNSVPAIGTIITHKDTLDLAQKSSQVLTQSGQTIRPGTEIDDKSLPIILKTDVVGTLEAILGSLNSNIKVVLSGTGPISESDVQLAQDTSALILGFRVKPTGAAKKIASIEKVTIKIFDTIYDLLDLLNEQAAEIGKEPEISENGKAKIKKVFDYKDFKVYGGVVTEGTISMNDTIIIQGVPDKKATITSLRQADQVLKLATKDQEFGAVLKGNLDITEGDTVTSITIKS